MDARKTIIVFVAPLVAVLLFLLVVLLEPHAVEVLLQHTAVLELVVCPSLMVRAGLLYHFVDDSPLWGSSRPFALHGGDEIVVEGFPLERLCFLLLLVLLGSSTGARIIIGGRLASTSFTAEEGADRFFPCSKFATMSISSSMV